MPASRKSEIFVDEFVDNRNNWNLIGTAQSTRSIQNGYYQFSSLLSGASFAARTINFDASKDFEIETSLQIVAGTAPTMLLWGASGSSNPYFFGFTPDSIGLYGNLQSGISLSRIDESISPAGYNTITVRKISNDYFFFLNGKPFDNGRFEDFFGNVHGFYVGGNATIRSDYLDASVNMVKTVTAIIETSPPVISNVGSEPGLSTVPWQLTQTRW